MKVIESPTAHNFVSIQDGLFIPICEVYVFFKNKKNQADFSPTGCNSRHIFKDLPAKNYF